MANTLPVPVTQQTNFDLANPMIAVTAILVIGTCYCVTVYTNAKYNRDTEISYANFHLKRMAPLPVDQDYSART